MRQPDINRARKALQHIEAARTVLGNIKWENVTTQEYELKQQALFNMETVTFYLNDMLNIQDNETH